MKIPKLKESTKERLKNAMVDLAIGLILLIIDKLTTH